MWTQIKMLIQEQFDMGLHCLTKRLLKHLGGQQKQTTFVVIGALRVNKIICYSVIRFFYNARCISLTLKSPRKNASENIVC